MMEKELESYSNSDYPAIPELDAEGIGRVCEFLSESEIRACDLLANGSNYVFLARLGINGREIKAIYKPRQGEAPLWDFPDGTLYKREYASFLVSRALEWDIIPPTVIREGPYGIGSMQWFVEPAYGIKHYLESMRDLNDLKRVAAFDCVVNNTDRKAGHMIEGDKGRLWVVDHGLTFNQVPKLRTVIWDFAGQKIPKKIVKDIRLLHDKLRKSPLREQLAILLDKAEIQALEHRIRKIMDKPVYPQPGERRSVPWPWV